MCKNKDKNMTATFGYKKVSFSVYDTKLSENDVDINAIGVTLGEDNNDKEIDLIFKNIESIETFEDVLSELKKRLINLQE